MDDLPDFSPDPGDDHVGFQDDGNTESLQITVSKIFPIKISVLNAHGTLFADGDSDMAAYQLETELEKLDKSQLIDGQGILLWLLLNELKRQQNASR